MMSVIREIVSDSEVAVLLEVQSHGTTRQSWGAAARSGGTLLGSVLQAATLDALSRCDAQPPLHQQARAMSSSGSSARLDRQEQTAPAAGAPAASAAKAAAPAAAPAAATTGTRDPSSLGSALCVDDEPVNKKVCNRISLHSRIPSATNPGSLVGNSQ
jgi:hypothetical protein